MSTAKDGQPSMNFGEAFGVGPAYGVKRLKELRESYNDEDIRLAPYIPNEDAKV